MRVCYDAQEGSSRRAQPWATEEAPRGGGGMRGARAASPPAWGAGQALSGAQVEWLHHTWTSVSQACGGRPLGLHSRSRGGRRKQSLSVWTACVDA